MAAQPVSVLLVEDEVSISEPFSAALRKEGFAVTVASTITAAQAVFEAGTPDVVLVDVMLPDGDGRELCRWMRAHSRQVAILMVTARGTETDRIVGLEIGADDYVVKPFSVAEVIARIRAVRRRSADEPLEPAGGRPVTIGELTVDGVARRVFLAGQELALRRKEFDLLARLVAEPGRAISRDTLMRDVWDPNWFGPTKTLDVHVGWLRRKLGDTPNASRYLHTVRGVGFRFATDEELRP